MSRKGKPNKSSLALRASLNKNKFQVADEFTKLYRELEQEPGLESAKVRLEALKMIVQYCFPKFRDQEYVPPVIQLNMGGGNIKQVSDDKLLDVISGGSED